METHGRVGRSDDRNIHRGHAFTIDRHGLYERIVSVPTLGIHEIVWASYLDALADARRLIDAHIRDHGHRPAPLTDEQRAEQNAEAFGGF